MDTPFRRFDEYCVDHEHEQYDDPEEGLQDFNHYTYKFQNGVVLRVTETNSSETGITYTVCSVGKDSITEFYHGYDLDDAEEMMFYAIYNEDLSL